MRFGSGPRTTLSASIRSFLQFLPASSVLTAIVQIRYLRRATEHIPRVERAYVFLAAEFQHTRRPNAIPNTGDIVEVRFALKNHGKTPAIMRRINAEIRVVDQLPIAFREIASDMPPGLVISAGETTDFFTHMQLSTRRRLGGISPANAAAAVPRSSLLHRCFWRPPRNRLLPRLGRQRLRPIANRCTELLQIERARPFPIRGPVCAGPSHAL